MNDWGLWQVLCSTPGNYATCLLFKPMCPCVPFPQTAAVA